MLNNIYVRWLAFVTILFTAAIEYFRLTWILVFFSGYGITGDGVLYFYMGRGLLNGLHMYTDLFETKPPGIFWLSELSLIISNNDFPYRLLQAVLLLSIPLILTGACVLFLKSHPYRKIACAATFLFGAAMASFIVDRTQGYQTEGFAVVPVIVCSMIPAFYSNRKIPIQWLLVSAACLTAAILLKEPFAISIVAASLLLIRTRRDVKNIASIALIGAFLWIGVLILTGVWQAYWSVYLPEMFAGRVVPFVQYHDYGTDTFYIIKASTFARGMNIVVMFKNVFATPFFLSAVAVTVLFVCQHWQVSKKEASFLSLFFGSLAVISGVAALNLLFVFHQMISLLHSVPLQSGFFLWKVVECTGLLAITIVTLWTMIRRRKKNIALKIIVCFCTLYLMMFSIGIGGDFTGKHFVFAVPAVIAAYIALLRSMGEKPGSTAAIPVCIVILLLIVQAVLPHRYDMQTLAADRAIINKGQAESFSIGPRVDALLDACGLDRYLQVGDLPYWTIHSPDQLTYGIIRAAKQTNDFYQTPANEYLKQKLDHDWAEMKVAFVRHDLTENLLFMYKEKIASFIAEPPECAKPFLPIPRVQTLFRQL